MQILNFGSLNLDYVYSVDHIVKPGETISSSGLEIFPGGKGLNQSVALARAGAKVYHAGMIGADGGMLLKICTENGIDSAFIRTVEERSGNAIIQVSGKGQNSIVLFGGANRKNDKAYVDKVLSSFQNGDLILLQNEINLNDYIIDKAHERGMIIAFNPSPFDAAVTRCNLEKIDYFLINEVEGEQITGKSQPEEILDFMKKNYSKAKTALTLGKHGVIYQADGRIYRHGIYDVPVVDTTAAGDTFTGYFLFAVSQGKEPDEALRVASVASSLAVSRKGATPSIPWSKEVLEAKLTEY